jgi:hypothetical protein
MALQSLCAPAYASPLFSKLDALLYGGPADKINDPLAPWVLSALPDALSDPIHGPNLCRQLDEVLVSLRHRAHDPAEREPVRQSSERMAVGLHRYLLEATISPSPVVPASVSKM